MTCLTKPCWKQTKDKVGTDAADASSVVDSDASEHEDTDADSVDASEEDEP
jgi:hypothetical protein